MLIVKPLDTSEDQMFAQIWWSHTYIYHSPCQERVQLVFLDYNFVRNQKRTYEQGKPHVKLFHPRITAEKIG